MKITHIGTANFCLDIDDIYAKPLPFFVQFYELFNIQVYWPARRLSAPNLGLVRMNSVSEEQEEEEEEEEGEQKEELVVKVKMRKPVFEEDEEKENCTLSNVPVILSNVPVMEAGRDVETPTIQAGRGIEKKATKKEFSGPLPALAVG